MATATTKSRCITCGKEKATSRCEGCQKTFCYNHLGEHRQQLSRQLDEIEVQRDAFQQTLSEQTTDPHKHLLVQQIDQWETESIEKIKRMANETRKILLTHTNQQINQTKEKLNQLTKQLKVSRDEDDIIESDLQKWKEELEQMAEQLNTPPDVVIQHRDTPLVKRIEVKLSVTQSAIPVNSATARCVQDGITVAGRTGCGNALNQLRYPYSVYVDDDQAIYVTDNSNNRVMEWKKDATVGEVVAGGNGPGIQNNQLNGPVDVIVDKTNGTLIISDYNNRRVVRWSRQYGRSSQTILRKIKCFGLAMDSDGYLYVSDGERNEVRRYKMGDANGMVVAGGNGEGSRLDQLNRPYFIFVDQEQSVYVSECYNHRVTKWMKGAREGFIVAGGRGQGDGFAQLSYPRGIVVDHMGTVYVADERNHRVMRWPKGAIEGSVILGGNGEGQQANQLNRPLGLSLDRQNNFLYVADFQNHRIQRFSLDSTA